MKGMEMYSWILTEVNLFISVTLLKMKTKTPFPETDSTIFAKHDGLILVRSCTIAK